MVGDKKRVLSNVGGIALLLFMVFFVVKTLSTPPESVDCAGIIAGLERVVSDPRISKDVHAMSVIDLREARAACGEG